MSEYASLSDVPEQDFTSTEASHQPLLPEKVPEGWKVVNLGDIKNLKNSRIEPEEMSGEAYISLKHLEKSQSRVKKHGVADDVGSQKYRFESGDILFGKLRPIFRKVVMPDFSGICSTDINVFEPIQGVNAKFLHYTLFREDFIQFADKTATGTRMPRADWDSLDEVLVAIPPIREQERLVNVISNIDSKATLNKDIGENLFQVTQELFVKIQSEAEREFTFSEICETSGGGTPSTDEDTYWGGSVEWLAPKEVTPLYVPIAYDTERKLTEEGLNNSSAKLMPSGSVLLTSRATVGEIAVNTVPMATNQGFICIQANEEIGTHFMAHLVKQYRPEIENLASGSTYPEISQRDFNSITVTLPKQEEIDRFNETVKPMYEQMETGMRENDNLADLRDTLLPKLLSGEIRLPA